MPLIKRLGTPKTSPENGPKTGPTREFLRLGLPKVVPNGRFGAARLPSGVESRSRGDDQPRPLDLVVVDVRRVAVTGGRVPDAKRLALATFTGAAKLAADSPDDLATLRAKVTSKGGTTEAALKIMMERQVKEAICSAVEAASARGQELGALLGRG